MNNASSRLWPEIRTHVHLAHSNCDYGFEFSYQSLRTCHTNTMKRQVREMSTTHDQRSAMNHHRTTSSSSGMPSARCSHTAVGSPYAAIRSKAYGLVHGRGFLTATASVQGGCRGTIASDRSGMQSARPSPTSQSRQHWQSARCSGVLLRPIIQPSATDFCWHALMLSHPA